MRRILILLLVSLAQPSFAAQDGFATNLSTKNYILKQFEAIRSANDLSEKRRLATQIDEQCLQADENNENIQALSNCRAGFRCAGIELRDFDPSKCESYMRYCKNFFLGGSAVPQNQKLDLSNASAEFYGIRLLEALGCKIPPSIIGKQESAP